jgi:hypothetical protein
VAHARLGYATTRAAGYDWPAGEFARARAARNVYVAMSGFKAAKDLPAWCNANPAGWDIVTMILNMKAQANKRQAVNRGR